MLHPIEAVFAVATHIVQRQQVQALRIQDEHQAVEEGHRPGEHRR